MVKKRLISLALTVLSRERLLGHGIWGFRRDEGLIDDTFPAPHPDEGRGPAQVPQQ
jgi:hypothetical protein